MDRRECLTVNRQLFVNDSNIFSAEVIVLAAEIGLIAHIDHLNGLKYLPQDINC